MANHDGNQKCLVEKNVPIALNLPSRWRDGADSDRAQAVYDCILKKTTLFSNI